MNDSRATTVAAGATGQAMTADQRAAFERDGYLLVPAVLDRDQVASYTQVVDELYQRHRQAGLLGAGAALHRLSAVATCPELAPLLDHPRVLGLVWSVLGWNVHVYHSHIDVHPPIRGERPFRFGWHQDGGRQNRELETDPRPRLSVKAAWWLSDVSRPGRGNLKLVPGSHTANRIDGPPRRDLPWPDPPGAVEVTAHPGDVVVFDRRVWHARSDNRSAVTRKAVFFGYTYRWVRIRDKTPTRRGRYTAVQRQLLGLLDDTDGDHAWGHEPARVPLYQLLRQTGQLDPHIPALFCGGPWKRSRRALLAIARRPVSQLLRAPVWIVGHAGDVAFGEPLGRHDRLVRQQDALVLLDYHTATLGVVGHPPGLLQGLARVIDAGVAARHIAQFWNTFQDSILIVNTKLAKQLPSIIKRLRHLS